MLKLRYHWKLQHAKERNAAQQIYRGMRDEFFREDEGYIHEVFNLSCKYGVIDLWHGISAQKENPLNRIRKIVQSYHMKKDMETARKGNCI